MNRDSISLTSSILWFYLRMWVYYTSRYALNIWSMVTVNLYLTVATCITLYDTAENYKIISTLWMVTLLFISLIVHVQGYVIVQLDFGFPQHLLVEFLKRTLNWQSFSCKHTYRRAHIHHINKKYIITAFLPLWLVCKEL